MKRIITIIAATVLLNTACSSTVTPPAYVAPTYETYVSAGQQLPLTKLTSINDQVVNLQEKGKRKLVILFATWCSDSQHTIKQVLASPIAQQKDLTIVGVGREESAESLEKFATEYQVNFPLVSDEKREIYRQFANAGIPRLILVDENNKIVKTLIGEDPNTIDKVTWQKDA